MPVDIRALVRIVLIGAVGGTVLALCAALVAIPNSQVTVAIVFRTVLITLLLAVVLPSVLNGLRPAVEAQRLQPTVILGAVIGYALDPFAWGGRAYATSLFTPPGPVTAIADLALWVAVAWAACALRVRPQHPSASSSGTSYAD